MAWASVATQSGALGSGGGTSASFDSTGADFIVLAVPTDGGVTLVGSDISDNKSNTSWQVLTTYLTASNVARIHIIYHASPAVGTGHTVTVTKSSSFCSIAIGAFSGGHASPYDQTDGGADFGTSIAPPIGITPPGNGYLLITALTSGGDPGTVTLPSGYTAMGTAVAFGSVYSIAPAYKIQATAALEQPSFTASNSTGMVVQIASFTPGAGAAGQPTAKRLGGVIHTAGASPLSARRW
jgi:hypothetical protein